MDNNVFGRCISSISTGSNKHKKCPCPALYRDARGNQDFDLLYAKLLKILASIK